jgi:chromate transport protein ChrA
VEFHGIKEGFIALVGLLTAPLLVIVCLGNIWLLWHDNPLVASVFAGISAAAAGLSLHWPENLRSMPRALTSWLILGGIIVAIALFPPAAAGLTGRRAAEYYAELPETHIMTTLFSLAFIFYSSRF